MKMNEMIKHFRAVRSLSQDDLARQIGCNKQFISNYERGIAPMPIAKIAQLCAYLRISKADAIEVMLNEHNGRLRNEFISAFNEFIHQKCERKNR